MAPTISSKVRSSIDGRVEVRFGTVPASIRPRGDGVSVTLRAG
jgi:hypothetical protein